MDDFDFEKFCKESDQRQREWDALPEEEKEKRRKSLAGWADRIEAENEALEDQIKEELEQMTPEERKQRDERVKQVEQKIKKPD